MQKRRKVGAAHGHTQGVNDLTAIEGEPVFEILFSINARAVIGHHGDYFFDVVFRCPIGQSNRSLWQGKAGANDERGSFRDAGSGCSHDHQGCFGLGGNRGRSQGQRRQAKTGQHANLVVDHQLLRNALGDIRRAGVVLHNQFHFFASNHVAVLRHVKFGSGFNLFARRSKWAGHGQDQANFEFFFGHGTRTCQ